MSGSDGLPICGVRGLALEDVDRERKVNEMVEFLARLESTNPRDERLKHLVETFETDVFARAKTVDDYYSMLNKKLVKVRKVRVQQQRGYCGAQLRGSSRGRTAIRAEMTNRSRAAGFPGLPATGGATGVLQLAMNATPSGAVVQPAQAQILAQGPAQVLADTSARTQVKAQARAALAQIRAAQTQAREQARATQAQAQARLAAGNVAMSNSMVLVSQEEEQARQHRRNKLDQVYECYYSSTEHFVSIGSRILKDLCTVQLGAPGSAQNLAQFIKEGHNALLYLDHTRRLNKVPSDATLSSLERTLLWVSKAGEALQHYPLAHETDRTTGKLASSGDTVPLAASGGATSIPPTPTIDPGMFDSLGIPVSVSPGTVGGLEEQLKQLVLEKPYMEGEQRWGSCAGADGGKEHV